MKEEQPQVCLSKTKASWQPVKAACVESTNGPFQPIEH